ncbi:MAG: hypothetical protein A2202_01885 [Bdellovibrionales bacterium RIFOXYA1_FULL_36_14]|nr:MAG: hypothetical protein A2202_01885 [Bdellovibrionales bacterium RIFOXYA1_FULL_36_14]
MKIKKIIGICLGLFVLLSIAFMVVSEIKKDESVGGSSQSVSHIGNQSKQAVATSDTIPSRKDKYVEGLYFHGTNRCHTCNLMEGYIRDVLKDSFDKEIKDGLLSFESVNVDEASNQHYIQNYQLQSISFFLSLKKDGKEIKFQNVDQIWQLARNESQFKSYIKSEIKRFLEM